MLQYTPEDILYSIFMFFHKFNYLDNLLLTNKLCNKYSSKIINFHYKNLNKFLDIKICKFYKIISSTLFYSKILNIKKLKTDNLINLKSLKTSPIIKLLLIYNEYYNYVSISNITIIGFKDFLVYFDSNITFIPFCMISNGDYNIFFEYNNISKSYRIKLKYCNTDVSIYKTVQEDIIIKMLSMSKFELLQMLN